MEHPSDVGPSPIEALFFIGLKSQAFFYVISPISPFPSFKSPLPFGLHYVANGLLSHLASGLIVDGVIGFFSHLALVYSTLSAPLFVFC